MAIQLSVFPHTLHFTFLAGTSRGVLREKKTWFLRLQFEDRVGLGEAGPLVGLSPDDRPDLEEELQALQSRVAQARLPESPQAVYAWVESLVSPEWPSLRFGLETAALDLLHGGTQTLFPGPFPQGELAMDINGLVWMGDAPTMAQRIEEKLAQGFRTLKLKIGALDFEAELELLSRIRERFGPDQITLRVDANGAFSPEEAPDKLARLAEFTLHSIEQPIEVRQWTAMAALCAESPVAVALDEELIGVHGEAEKERLLDTLKPPYIILKPTLVGGLGSTAEWIRLAEEREIAWWITSALESNVGLNAIAQFTATYRPTLPQGLGTGQLYHNNIPAPLHQSQGWLRYDPGQSWDFGVIFDP